MEPLPRSGQDLREVGYIGVIEFILRRGADDRVVVLNGQLPRPGRCSNSVKDN
jgi:hypothetical protein